MELASVACGVNAGQGECCCGNCSTFEGWGLGSILIGVLLSWVHID